MADSHKDFAKGYPKTEAEKQKRILEKLLQKPDRPVEIQLKPPERTVGPAPDFVNNVQASSSGAGSGEFHTYKIARRREYERIKIMEEEIEHEKALKDFEAKKSAAQAKEDAKAAKNRLKRQKRKQKQGSGKKAKTDGDSSAEDSPEATTLIKNAGMKQDTVERHAENSTNGEQAPTVDNGSTLPPPVAIKGNGIKVVDEDDAW